jgi:hypothetical protein
MINLIILSIPAFPATLRFANGLAFAPGGELTISSQAWDNLIGQAILAFLLIEGLKDTAVLRRPSPLVRNLPANLTVAWDVTPPSPVERIPSAGLFANRLRRRAAVDAA